MLKKSLLRETTMTQQGFKNKRALVGTTALVVVALFLGVILGYFIAPRQSSSASTQIITVPIGALLPLTGDLSSFGKRNQHALELAVQDINAFAESVGSPFRFKLLVEDTA
ncbi:MAG: hypothetical protein ACPL0G_06500, partial [Infirmifilum uzonense]